jgi:acyl carrier protein
MDLLSERFGIDVSRMTIETPIREFGLDSILMLDVLLKIEDSLGLKLTDLAMPANPKVQDIDR